MEMRAFILGVVAAMWASGCIPSDSNIVGGEATNPLLCTPACSAAQRCVNGVCVGEGQLRFTLTWDRPGDMDLHVVVPGNEVINYGALSAGGGRLDRDDRSGTGPENIFWSAAPPAGEYLVCVIPYAITGPTTFRLDVRTPGEASRTLTGQRADSNGATTATCSRTSPYFVQAFTVGGAPVDAGPAGDVPVVTDAAVDAGGLVDLPITVDAGLADAATVD